MTPLITIFLLPIICLLILVGIGVFLWRSLRSPRKSNVQQLTIIIGACLVAVPVFLCMLWAIYVNLIWYSWGKSMNDRVEQRLVKTKEQIQLDAVKQAAMPLFSLAGTNLTSKSLPKEITSLPVFADNPEGVDCWHVTTNSLIFSAGGGFGHWGLIICQGKPQIEDTQDIHAVVTPLGDGVFIWREL
jgi:hypothetical protein